MALIDRIKFEGPADLLVWKYPKDNIVLGSQLIVNQSQEALFFKDGRALDLMGPGSHTLHANNIPILQKLINLPFGGETPFAAEVYIVNRVSKLDYKWGTRSPILVDDPKYNVSLNVGAFGQFGLRVTDSRLLVTELVGTLPVWDASKITDCFRGLVIQNVKNSISKFLVRMGISITQVSGYLDELSQAAGDGIREEFARFGLELLNFYITSISIPEEESRRIQEGQFQRLQMDQLGDERYARMRNLDVLETAASNPGASGTLLAGGMGLGIGMQMMNQAGQMAQAAAAPTAPAAPQSPTPVRTADTCGACKAPMAPGARFCAQCGQEVARAEACPKCGAAAAPGAKFCGACGTPLSPRPCPKCGALPAPGARFCGECGQSLGA